MTRRYLPVVVLLVLVSMLAACGASARETTLRASFVAVTAAQAGFESWDRDHQLDIVDKATSYEDGVAKLEAYWKARTALANAFELAYRTIAAALLANDGHTLTVALRARQELQQAYETLTGKRLP